MTNYFTVGELIKSDTAIKYGINNSPDALTLSRLKELIAKLLNPIREAWGSPILVSSGYRCKELNAKVGGAKTSAHLLGYAADLIPKNGRIKEFIAFVQNFLRTKGISFDQCIDEYGRWVHVGLKNGVGLQRKQIFKIR